MSENFLSSDEFAEHAHQLYNNGRYEEAIDFIREGLGIYPSSVELHVGLGYARLATEEYAWAREAFDKALGLDPEDEEGLAGMGEVLLKLGRRNDALSLFERVVALGFREDHDLMLQIARSLFRENELEAARGFFKVVANTHAQSSEAVAGLGYVAHRLGDEDKALDLLRRALEIDGDHVEARIYLGNVLYDRGEYDDALQEYERTQPDHHFDELALWRVMELKRSFYKLEEGDPELEPWARRLEEFSEGVEPEDRLLEEVESQLPDGTVRDPNQIDMFAALLTDLHTMKRHASAESHKVRMPDGTVHTGTWQEIVLLMSRRDPGCNGDSIAEYMGKVSERNQLERGLAVPATDPAEFVTALAAAGMLVILR